jgi:hypothetical protein
MMLLPLLCLETQKPHYLSGSAQLDTTSEATRASLELSQHTREISQMAGICQDGFGVTETYLFLTLDLQVGNFCKSAPAKCVNTMMISCIESTTLQQVF